MVSIPNKVKDRLIAGIKKFQPVLASAKSRDINESDTVVIITDMLSDVFGYDKFLEVTHELGIRGTRVDLAIKIDGHLQMLIEVKAVGLDLKEAFIKQAVDYAANAPVDWVILTSGTKWQIYKIKFGKPIEQELVVEFDVLELNPKSTEHLELLYLITKEGLSKSLLGDYQAQREALSRYFIGAILLTDTVLDVVRRELKRVSPDVKIDNEQIKSVLIQETLKREVVEGDKADEARRKISRVADRSLRKSSKEATDSSEQVSKIESAPQSPVETQS